jgi:alpha-1,3-glucosyltransferase
MPSLKFSKKKSNEKNFVFLFRGSPLTDFLYPFKKAANQWVARYIIVIFAIIIRFAVGLGSYSGENTPPMFGDFEAQRHWLEITTNLPITQWYFYDLQYWGLDYPPLTAYHSWLLGKIGNLIDKSWFVLDTSRGIESVDLKSYMRLTAVISELTLYIPAVIMYTRWMGREYNKAPSINQTIIAAAILFLPDLIIIDHGHFQYNSIMLGLTLLALNNLLSNNLALGSILFTLSIGFKQMSLYYAPIFFFYLLSLCVFPKFNLLKLIYIATSVISTLIFLFGPFVYAGGFSQIGQILYRIFPFNRGIFEDKVANFWCATNIIIKYKKLFTVQQLQKLSLILTLIGITPSSLAIFFNPNKRLLAWCLASCSMSFFLFSFQVHEKSILLPWLPTTLLLNEVDADVISMVCWFCNVSLFSMSPLLNRDGLVLQYLVLGILSNWLMGNLSWVRKYTNFVFPFISNRENATPVLPHSWFWRIIIVGFYIVSSIVLYCDFFVEPPEDLPDLWVIGNVLISFASFTLIYLWMNYKIYVIYKQKIKFD